MINNKISFSLVLYKQPFLEIEKVISSLLLYKGEMRIFILDNSPTDELKIVQNITNVIQYEHMKKNLGFGAAHNIAFKYANNYGSHFHFIVNPDIHYTEDVVGPMVEYMTHHQDVGMMMPRILYPNGNIQTLPKLLPSPAYLLIRRLKFLKSFHEKAMQNFEMRMMRNDQVYDIASASGCFVCVRTEILTQINGYDNRFFMYFEDTDMSYRISQTHRIIYFPYVSVFHEYGHGATKNLRLFIIFVYSALRYFCKWGWFFDSTRKKRNEYILSTAKKKNNQD